MFEWGVWLYDFSAYHDYHHPSFLFVLVVSTVTVITTIITKVVVVVFWYGSNDKNGQSNRQRISYQQTWQWSWSSSSSSSLWSSAVVVLRAHGFSAFCYFWFCTTLPLSLFSFNLILWDQWKQTYMDMDMCTERIIVTIMPFLFIFNRVSILFSVLHCVVSFDLSLLPLSKSKKNHKGSAEQQGSRKK